MSKTFKKILAVCLSVLLFASLIPAATFTVGALDLSEYAEAPVLALNTETDVAYDGTVASGVFRFIPESDGTYVFYSSGNNDTYVSVYNEYGSVGGDDDSGDGSNFSVTFYAGEGITYYLLSRLYDVGGSGDYTVTLTEYQSPIDHIEVADVSVVKDLSGSVYTDAQDNEYFHYDYPNPEVTVYFNNGNPPRTAPYNIYIDNQLGYVYLDNYEDGQDENHWTDVGTYTVNATFAGMATSFNVNVIENPVDRVEIENVKVIKEQGGYESYDWDTGGNYYYYNYLAPKYTVYYKDGTVSETDASDKRVLNDYYHLDRNDNQTSVHWTVGNTYTVPCTFAGVACSYDVSVVENPITAVQVDDVVLYENIGGYFSTDGNGERYYHYYMNGTPDYTVTYDGVTTEKNSSNKAIYNNSYSLNFNIDQYTQHFEAGQTYVIPCTICGFETSFNVIVNESPVSGVVIDDITVVENFGGSDATDYYGNPFYYYYLSAPYYTVTFADGTQSEKTRYSTEIMPGVYESLDYYINQYENHLVLGENKITATFAGKEYEFCVNVIKNPVQSLAVEEVVVYENFGGYTDTGDDGEPYYRYQFACPESTLLFGDGTTSEKATSHEVNGTVYSLQYSDYIQGENSQRTNHWTVGNTYEVNYTFMDKEGTFNVRVEPNPILGVDIDDVVLISGVDGYTTYDNYGNEYFYYYVDSPAYTVRFRDGSQSEKTTGSTEFWGSFYTLDYNIYQYQRNTHFLAGNTYSIPCTFAGIECSFNVTVKTSPITRIVFDEVSVIENIDGYNDTDSNGNTYFRYNYSLPRYTAYFDDGTNSGKVSSSIQYNGDSYWPSTYDDQYENHWTAGNTYNATFTVLGFETTFEVTVKKSPILGVTVDKTVILEETSGEIMTDGSGQEYFRYTYRPAYTVSLDNGTTTEKTQYSTRIGGRYYNLEFTDDQYENHWEVGHTYTVPFTFMGYSGTFEVEIKESPVKSVVIEPAEVIEGIDGEFDTDWDGNEFFRYYVSPEYTVYFKDGTHTATNRYSKTINGQSVGLIRYDDQAGAPWTVGNTYTVTYEFMGIVTTSTVTVVPNPVKSVKVSDVTIIENTGGRYSTDALGNRYYEYYTGSLNPQYVISFKDGTSKTVTGSYNLGDSWYSLEFNDDQSVTHWTVGGTYTVPCNFAGVESTCEVTIVENPVQSVVVNDITVIENGSGYFTTDGSGQRYFYYTGLNPSYTVYYKDNTYSANVTGSIRIGNSWYGVEYSTDQTTNHWTAGNTYEVDCTFMGIPATFNVTVAENPIASITVSDLEVIENSNGYFYTDYNTGEKYFQYRYSPRFSVTYNDGSSEENLSGSVKIGDMWYSINCEDNQDDVHWTVGGTYEATATLAGVETTFNVTVVPSPVKSIEVENVTVIENSNGWISTDENTIEYFEYEYSPRYRVTFKDGTTTDLSEEGKLIGDRYYYLENFADGQEENHWTVGNTYNVTCKFLGAEGSFTVSVIANPVASIEVDNIVIIDKIGMWSDTDDSGAAYMRYPYSTPAYSVTFKDGKKTEKNNKGKEISGQTYWLEWEDTQNKQPWTVGGTYTVPCEFLGVKSSFTVTVKPISYFASTIPALTLNTPKAMSYDGSVLSGLARFTPAADGTYVFSTTGKWLTDGTLYDSNGQQVAYDYGDAQDYNYRITTQLKAGQTYYILSEGFPMMAGSETGKYDFNVIVTGAEGPVGCPHTEVETRGAREANCTEAGYSGDIYCKECGEKIASGRTLPALGHGGGTATCHSKATCIRCGVEYGEFNPNNHDGATEIRDEVKATCTAYGYSGDTYCLGCGAMIAEGEETPLADHTVGEWLSNSEAHWHHCSQCEQDVDRGVHEYTWKVTKKATSTESGLKEEICAVCGYKSGNSEVVEYGGYEPGDINGDGNVNNKDLTRLFQYLSDWDVAVNEDALDVNGDGSVNNKDLTRLFQYLSDWDVQIF